jgi:hypothetical protein
MRFGGFVLTMATATALLAQSSPSYRVIHSYALGGDGSWDYIVDALLTGGRRFHSRRAASSAVRRCRSASSTPAGLGIAGCRYRIRKPRY